MKRETGRAGSWPITTGKMVKFYQNLVCSILRRIRSTATSCNQSPFSLLSDASSSPFFCQEDPLLQAPRSTAHPSTWCHPQLSPYSCPPSPKPVFPTGLEWGREQRNKNHMAWVLPSIPLRKLGQILSNSLGLSLPVAKLIIRQNHISFHF